MLKRFLLFSHEKDCCQPAWSCFCGDFDTLEEAVDIAQGLEEREDPYCGWQIVDTKTRKVVKEIGYELE